MINEASIRESVAKAIEGTDLFIVDIRVSAGPKVAVELDSPKGITIGECRTINKKIEEDFDREVQDYELTVSSPGLEKPFKVPAQYEKNIGRSLEIELNNGTKLNGKLIAKTGEQISVETKEKVKTGNKKVELVQVHELKINDIKQTKVVISFK